MGMFCDSWEDAINRIEDAKEYFIKAAFESESGNTAENSLYTKMEQAWVYMNKMEIHQRRQQAEIMNLNDKIRKLEAEAAAAGKKITAKATPPTPAKATPEKAKFSKAPPQGSTAPASEAKA